MRSRAARRRRHEKRPGLEGERSVSLEMAQQLGASPPLRHWLLPLGATLAVHATLATLAVLADREHQPKPVRETTQVTLEKPVQAEPASPPAAQPPPPPPPRAARRSAPPAAARAGKAVTAEPRSSQPLDLTQFDMPVGKSESYAGGFTAPAGTSAAAVNDPRAHPRGVVGGTGAGMARPASPLRREWACAWPDEEASSDLREARVTIRVSVDVGGRAERVEVLGSPPASFASAARACARGESFQTARDDAGREVPGVTPPFVVHFVR